MFDTLVVFHKSKGISVSGVKNPKAVSGIVNGIANQLGWSPLNDEFNHKLSFWNFNFETSSQTGGIQAPTPPGTTYPPDLV